MRDFSVGKYKELLDAFIQGGYQFLSFEDYLEGNWKNSDKLIMLRHDVDARKLNSLEFARIQNKVGAKGTYYFRMVPESFHKDVIKEVYSLGH